MYRVRAIYVCVICILSALCMLSHVAARLGVTLTVRKAIIPGENGQIRCLFPKVQCRVYRPRSNAGLAFMHAFWKKLSQQDTTPQLPP